MSPLDVVFNDMADSLLYSYTSASYGIDMGKEKKHMRSLYRVYVINKRDEILVSKAYVIASDCEEAKLKEVQKLSVDYDSRAFHICAEEITNWRVAED